MIDVHIPANFFYPELPGGALQYYRYGPYLKKRGVQLHVHVARKPHHQEAKTEIQSIHITRYKMDAEISMLEELELLTERAMEAAGKSGNPSIIQPLGTAGASVSSVLRLWRARIRGLPSCFHYTDVPVRQEYRFPDNLREILRMWILISPFRGILTCSSIMGRAFEDYCGVSSKRFTAVPNGIDLSVFSPVDCKTKQKLRQQLNLSETAPIILYVGSVIARKGVDVLIEAWKQVLAGIPEARLVIVGSTRPRPTIRRPEEISESECFHDQIAKQVAGLKEPESVIFAGEVDNVRDYYRASDLFAFASRHEGLPSVVMEAMACGIPCVTAPFTGLPDDGEEYGIAGTHFVKTTHDPTKMSQDILKLLEDSEARIRMGQEAAKWIAETQEIGKAADQLAAFYRKLVGVN